MPQAKLNVFNVSDPRIMILHLSWFAFFLSFMMWFSHAPLRDAIMTSFELTGDQWKALLILNVALTIPSRIVVGMLVDKHGPRRVYSALLLVAGFLCLFFATASSFQTLALARLLMGFIGAGFVVGIRMIGEWFPARQVGLAEGIYGGWGNFGSAAAAWTLPSLMLFFGGENGWRYAILATGALSFCYAFLYYWKARDTPKGSTYFKPRKSGGLEVSTRSDFYFLIVMTVPMYGCLAALVWKLSPGEVNLLPYAAANVLYAALVVLFALQVYSLYQVNKEMLKQGTEDLQRYKFKQVAILDINYFVTFGSELAVVSMLPAFFMDTFGLGAAAAGFFGGGFALMNLLARPMGGLVSDRFGRRPTMLVLIAGLAGGYLLMAQVDETWPIGLAVAATMVCSFFVQSGEGAVFALVPLVKRRLSGQIAGMVGAYGNVGAVCFLTVYSFVDAATFFLAIGCSSALAFGATLFLDEPEGHTVEVREDGSVELIEVA